MRPVLFHAAVAVALTASASAVRAESVSKTVPFEVDRWYELKVEEGPVTLHRIRIASKEGLVSKSKIFRPGNSEYLETVQIQIEYSNTASKDWKAELKIHWLDEQDRIIDGYNGSEDLGDDEKFQHAHVSLSTLKYGLDRAKKLRIRIDAVP
ncbi:MAG TPA: hypothetical protein VJU18_14745 [Vicinamibacteria bacterium]|nr:hypothetical protein [Vicinamibacteria bacterium]